MKKILILGGGFAAVEVYRLLHKKFHPLEEHGVRIDLINRTNYFTFSPMLHEVATGSVSREHIVQPIREMLTCCGNDFHQAVVTGIDLANRTVHTSTRDHTFDYGVIALGVNQGYFGIPGAKEHALPLKSIDDAVTIRNRIINSFEKASETFDVHDIDSMKQFLHFIIVGGGLTGVELAGQISDLIRHEMVRYYEDVPHDQTRITLIHAGNRILEQLSPQSSQIAEKRLTFLGAHVMVNEQAAHITKEGVELASGKHIKSKNVFWTAGTQSSLASLLPAHVLSTNNLVAVEPTMQVIGYPNMFALGDCAECQDPLFHVPATAQGAVQTANIAATNILARIEGKPCVPHTYFHKGTIVPIGDWYAIFELSRFRFRGAFAWILRRAVFLQSMYSWKKRMQVLLSWVIRGFLPRDISEF